MDLGRLLAERAPARLWLGVNYPQTGKPNPQPGLANLARDEMFEEHDHYCQQRIPMEQHETDQDL
jgi:hypothetical protein